MKARLKEMEDEAAKLRAMQARVDNAPEAWAPVADAAPRHPQASVEKEMGALPMATDADREEVDLRSIFVGNVRGAAVPPAMLYPLT